MPLRLKSNLIMKANVDAMLARQGKNRAQLARWCMGQDNPSADSWMSHIMNEPNKGFPVEHWDRIADFFGVEIYQLLVPGGISPEFNRRKGERRAGPDRRVSSAIQTDRPADMDVIHIIRALSVKGRDQAIGMLTDILNTELRRRPSRGGDPYEPGNIGGTDRGGSAPQRKK